MYRTSFFDSLPAQGKETEFARIKERITRFHDTLREFCELNFREPDRWQQVLWDMFKEAIFDFADGYDAELGRRMQELVTQMIEGASRIWAEELVQLHLATIQRPGTLEKPGVDARPYIQKAIDQTMALKRGKGV
jgi:hypothetical protein